METVKDLKNTLALLKPAVSGRATLPVLSAVRFEKDRVWTTDLQGTITVRHSENGVTNAVISHSQLPKVAGALSAKSSVSLNQVDEKVTDKYTRTDIEIVSDHGTTRLQGLNVDDFPGQPLADKSPAHSISLPEDFVERFYAVAKAASTDESRTILTGVHCELSGKTLHLVTTNSYELFMDQIRLPVDVGRKAISFTLPVGYLKSLAKLDGPITLNLIGEITDHFEYPPAYKNDEGQWITPKPKKRGKRLAVNGVHVTRANVTVTMRPIEGEFPKWKQLIPTDFAGGFVLDQDKIDELLPIFVKLHDGGPQPIKLSIVGGTNNVPASMEILEQATHEAVFPTTDKVNFGDPDAQGVTTLAFRPQFLSACIAFAGPKVDINDDLKPAAFSGNGKRRALLMPVRLS